jgi:hypothetical protein
VQSAKSKEQRAKCKVQSAKCKEQRAKSKEQRAKSKMIDKIKLINHSHFHSFVIPAQAGIQERRRKYTFAIQLRNG